MTRIFLGDLPPLFLLEILLRTTVIYLYALFVIRLLGKRGLGQLAPFDFVIIIALGSAVGDPMFYPDVPLLHSMVVLTLIVIFTRGIERLTERSSKIKDFVDSTTTRLVVDGRVDCAGIKGEGMRPANCSRPSRRWRRAARPGRARLSRTERKGYDLHVRSRASTPGPRAAAALRRELAGAARRGRRRRGSGAYCCWNCGEVLYLTPPHRFARCPRCHGRQWTTAVRAIDEQLKLIANDPSKFAAAG